MATVLTQELFQNVVDQALREVITQMSGIALIRGGSPPSGELCTVYTAFDGNFQASLLMCADNGMFIRMAQRLTHREQVAKEDIEDAVKEFFNVLCGHIAVDLFRATQLKAHFHIPYYVEGCHIPNEQEWPLVLNYCADAADAPQVNQGMHVDLGMNKITLKGKCEILCPKN